jgi:hypothetical protein
MDWQILHHHHYVDVSMVAYWLNHKMSYLRVVTRILGLVEAFFIVNNADHNIIYDYTTEIRSLCSKRGNERARAAIARERLHRVHINSLANKIT